MMISRLCELPSVGASTVSVTSLRLCGRGAQTRQDTAPVLLGRLRESSTAGSVPC